jgi:TATA-box binding protein (TBP) (component of TFIID and TFIIIB)
MLTYLQINMETPALTTMVVLVRTPFKMNTEILLHNLPIQYPLLKVEKQGVLRRGESARDKIKRRAKTGEPKRNTGFGHNSLTMVLLSKGDGQQREKEITVKLFQNGVFHITGVLHDSYDNDVVKVLLDMIRTHCPTGMEATEGEIERRIVLMNYKTRILGNTAIAREKMYTDLRAAGTKVAYEPGVYPAVKIYFEGQRWIAKVFRTGNVILTGMTSHDEAGSLMNLLQPLLEGILPASQGVQPVSAEQYQLPLVAPL